MQSGGFMGPKNHKQGFTLAEVLITLGIIGVVAALTMPMLIGNYQKKVTAEKLKKLYLNYENTLQLTETEEGLSRTEWRFATTTERNDFINNKIVPNLNCQKFVENIGDSSRRYSPICVLNDGGIIAFHEYSAGSLTEIEIFFILDANKLQNNDILWGKNGFYYSTSTTETSNITGKYRTHLLDTCKQGIKNQQNHSSTSDFIDYESRYCINLIRYDGWEIRNDYPW